MNNVVSLSGGKDSTAMLHMMLEKGENIHSVVWMDTGWEFPEMAAHIDEVERKTGLSIIRIKPKKSFDHWMYSQRIHARKGANKGQLVRIGYGWPHSSRRWCTRENVQAIAKHERKVPDLVKCVGFASDELHRCKPGLRYPLIEYGVTEADAIEYCRKLGYTWGGLYDIFKRVSCWCCPLQSIKDLRKLRHHRPELWAKLLEMDARMPANSPGFKNYWRAADFERRFAREDMQLEMWKAA